MKTGEDEMNIWFKTGQVPIWPSKQTSNIVFRFLAIPCFGYRFVKIVSEIQKRYRRTDRRTDTASYRDARTHLKSVFHAFHRSALAEDTATSRNVIEIAYSRDRDPARDGRVDQYAKPCS